MDITECMIRETTLQFCNVNKNKKENPVEKFYAIYNRAEVEIERKYASNF